MGSEQGKVIERIHRFLQKRYNGSELDVKMKESFLSLIKSGDISKTACQEYINDNGLSVSLEEPRRMPTMPTMPTDNGYGSDGCSSGRSNGYGRGC